MRRRESVGGAAVAGGGGSSSVRRRGSSSSSSSSSAAATSRSKETSAEAECRAALLALEAVEGDLRRLRDAKRELDECNEALRREERKSERKSGAGMIFV